MRSAPDWAELKRSIRVEFPGVPQISTGELADWLNDPSRQRPALLDAREPREFAVSHLRDAQLAPDVETALRLVGTAKPNPPIVVYCSVGYRSSRLAKDLMDRGVLRVANLEGSIFQWANEERPVYRGLLRVERVHPYNNTWGQLLDSRFREGIDKELVSSTGRGDEAGRRGLLPDQAHTVGEGPGLADLRKIT